MVQKKRRPTQLFIFGLSLAALVLLVHVSGTIFVRNEVIAGVLAGFGLPLWSLLVTVALLYAARQSADQSLQARRAWQLLAASQFVVTIGGLTVLTYILGYPIPELFIHSVYLCAYPLAVLGVLLLPAKPLTGSAWLKTALDMAIVLMAATLVLWRYWLEPMIVVVGDKSLSLQLQVLVYPVGHLLLLWALLVLLYRQATKATLIPVYLLVLGAGASTVADFNYGRQVVYGAFALGGWQDLGWVVASLSYGLAGLWQATSVTATRSTAIATADDETPRRLTRWLIHAPAVCTFAVFLILQQGNWQQSYRVPWAPWTVSALMGLLLIRQLVTLHENQEFYVQIHRQAIMLQAQIEERKRIEDRLAHEALHDPLTGLPNRAFFLERLRNAMTIAEHQQAGRFAVLFLDLDHFKVVNDSLGHMMGDQLLLMLAQRLRQCLHPGNIVARLGGDEFVILVENIQDVQEPVALAQQIHASLKQPLNLYGHLNFASASIGIVCDDGHYEHPADVLRDADIAMYQAKTHGKDCYELFSVAMREQAQSRLALENDLYHALEREEFELFYQPILSLASDKIIGFEALLRWHHPQRGLVSPAEFIPIAEETGLILPIGHWVLLAACRQLHAWQTQFPCTPPLTMSVNISGKQFSANGFLEQVDAVLQEVGIDPHTLRLEITESVWLNRSGQADALFKTLHSKGMQFHIDDFGTGYSSLIYLQDFPIQTIKIDRTFVSRMADGADSTEIVRAMIDMAHDLGLETVAEGVETVEQLGKLKKLGCNYGQGYLLSRPINQAETEKLLLDPPPHTTRPAPPLRRAAYTAGEIKAVLSHYAT